MMKAIVIALTLPLVLSSCSSNEELCSSTSEELRSMLLEKIKPHDSLVYVRSHYEDLTERTSETQKRTEVVDVVKTGQNNAYQCKVFFYLWGNPEETPLQVDAQGNMVTLVRAYNTQFSFDYSISEKGGSVVSGITWENAENAIAAKKRVYQQEHFAMTEFLKKADKDLKEGKNPNSSLTTYKIISIESTN